MTAPILLSTRRHVEASDQKAEATVPLRFPFLDGIRGLTAVYVVVYHFLAWVPSALPPWITRLQRSISFGHVGVAIFIVLSGFSLMLPVTRSADGRLRGGTLDYFRRRARRILPPYLAAVVLAVAVASGARRSQSQAQISELAPANILMHLALVHNLFRASAFNLNMAHWSVAAESQIYLFFPFILLPIWRRAGRAAMLAAGFCIASLPLILLPSKVNFAWTCPWYLGLFAMGAVAATVVVDFPRLSCSGFLIAGAGVSVGTYVLMHWYLTDAYGGNLGEFKHPWVNMSKDCIAGCGISLVLVYCAGTAAKAGGRYPILAHLLGSGPLVFLGGMSYSLYLTHCSVLDLCVLAGSRTGLSELSLLMSRTFIGVPSALFVGYLFYRLFERPFVARALPSRSKPSAPGSVGQELLGTRVGGLG